MNIPDAFRQVALHMHQDIHLIVRSEDELFEYLARIAVQEGRMVVVAFIDQLLDSDLSDRQLSDLWGEAGADWYFFDDGARPFFERLRDEIAAYVDK